VVASAATLAAVGIAGIGGSRLSRGVARSEGSGAAKPPDAEGVSSRAAASAGEEAQERGAEAVREEAREVGARVEHLEEGISGSARGSILRLLDLRFQNASFSLSSLACCSPVRVDIPRCTKNCRDLMPRSSGQWPKLGRKGEWRALVAA
jgi:hypothetical protein